MAADDTMSALVLGRNAHLAEGIGAVHERLGVRPRFFAWLVRMLARLTIVADDICSFQRLPPASRTVHDYYFDLVGYRVTILTFT